MTTTLTAAGFTLDYRASMLRGLAERWDPCIFDHDRWLTAHQMTQAERNVSTDRLIDTLTMSAAEYADPILPIRDIRSWMEELRDAVNALRRFEAGEGWDGDEDDEKHLYTDETVLALLNADIDYALWPLLNGMSTTNVCFRCSRSHRPPTSWNVREPLQPNCADCEARK